MRLYFALLQLHDQKIYILFLKQQDVNPYFTLANEKWWNMCREIYVLLQTLQVFCINSHMKRFSQSFATKHNIRKNEKVFLA